MDDKLDKAVGAIQEALTEQLKGEYSEKVIKCWLDPKHVGNLERPEGHGKIKGPCGDTMEISLRMKDDNIVDAKFLTDGCTTSIAAAEMASQLAVGKSVEEAFDISQQAILDALDGLPEDSEHCALLASNTLKEALRSYLAYKREPWIRDY